MKTLKLILPDSTYNVALRHANAEGVDPAHYCSSLITECLGNGAEESPTKLAFGTPIPSHIEPSRAASSGRKLPDTVEQVFAICRYVWQSKMEYSDAVRKVARDLCVQETTVRDKCTRRIELPDVKLTTDAFLGLLARPNALVEHLCRKFPSFSTDIRQLFAPIFTSKP